MSTRDELIRATRTYLATNPGTKVGQALLYVTLSSEKFMDYWNSLTVDGWVRLRLEINPDQPKTTETK